MWLLKKLDDVVQLTLKRALTPIIIICITAIILADEIESARHNK